MGIRSHKTRKRTRIRNLVLLILVTAAAVGALIIELSSGIRAEIGESLMRRTADGAETALRDQLDKLFEPLQGHLAVVERWGERGALELSDHRALNALFIPMLEQFPWATSMLIANEHGVEYMLLREDSTWVTRATDTASHPGRVQWRRWTDDDSTVAAWWEDLDYDPRQRPWYVAAVEEQNVDERGICWTRPYKFYTSQQIGVTLSKRWRTRGKDAASCVAGVDVPLDAILEFAGGLVRKRDGYSFLFNRDGLVIAADTDKATPTRDPTEFETEALRVWTAAGSTFEFPLQFSSDGDRWWGDFRVVSTDSLPPWLAVAVPESSFAGEVRSRQHGMAAIVGGLLLLGMLITVLGAQFVPRSVDGEDRLDLSTEQALRDLIAKGESDTLEFKSTMRWNLNADKPGKEIEISWLKTVVAYLNSAGGVLVIGVNDDGEVTGIDADRFANDDKYQLHYNNLFKQHIGLEFAEYIEAGILAVGDKKVFVLQCRKSSEPVFLKKGKEEQFYVRIGPSSRQLSMSQVVDRLNKKK